MIFLITFVLLLTYFISKSHGHGHGDHGHGDADHGHGHHDHEDHGHGGHEEHHWLTEYLMSKVTFLSIKTQMNWLNNN